MPEPDFRTIERRLLQGGVAPRHVRRTVRELGHHYADLLSKAQADGAPAAEAAILARERLGSEDEIVKEVLRRPELKSWAHRRPWMFYGVAPLVLYWALIVLVVAPIGVWLNIADDHLSREEFFDMVNVVWVRFIFENFTALILHPLAIVIGAAVCLIAAKRDMPLLWPVIGGVLVAFFGSGLDHLPLAEPHLRAGAFGLPVVPGHDGHGIRRQPLGPGRGPGGDLVGLLEGQVAPFPVDADLLHFILSSVPAGAGFSLFP